MCVCVCVSVSECTLALWAGPTVQTHGRVCVRVRVGRSVHTKVGDCGVHVDGGVGFAVRLDLVKERSCGPAAQQHRRAPFGRLPHIYIRVVRPHVCHMFLVTATGQR
jgi:hypothetical protein